MATSISSRGFELKIYLEDRTEVFFTMLNRKHSLGLQKFLCNEVLEKTNVQYVAQLRQNTDVIIKINNVGDSQTFKFRTREDRERFMGVVTRRCFPNLRPETFDTFTQNGSKAMIWVKDVVHEFEMQQPSCASSLVHMMNNRGTDPIFTEGEVTVVIGPERAGFASPEEREKFLFYFPPQAIWRTNRSRVRIHPKYISLYRGVLDDHVFNTAHQDEAKQLAALLNSFPMGDDLWGKIKIVDGLDARRLHVGGRTIKFGKEEDLFDFINRVYLVRREVLGITEEFVKFFPFTRPRENDTVELANGRRGRVVSSLAEADIITVRLENDQLYSFNLEDGRIQFDHHYSSLLSSEVMDTLAIVKVIPSTPQTVNEVWLGSDEHTYLVKGFDKHRIKVLDEATEEVLFFDDKGVHERLDVRLVKKLK